MAAAEQDVQNKTQERSLSTQLQEREVTVSEWHTLSKNLYPGAKAASVLMVVDYCRARGLDPLKKPCHIVPMYVEDSATGTKEWRDVIMPGIYELRTTAARTGEYLGHAKPEYGEVIEAYGVTAPAYCDFTVYRWNEKAQRRGEYPVRVWFNEVIGTRKDRKTGEIVANGRWARAPIQMLTKCAEAAALREAFPDELGGQMSAEEFQDQQSHGVIIEGESVDSAADKLNAEFGLIDD